MFYFSNLDTKGEEDVLDVLENIDDDLDRLNIAMVKVYEREAFKEWGVSDKTSIFYFENGIPNIYSGFKGLKKSHLSIDSWILKGKPPMAENF